jgi:hypothetical protein
MIALATWVENVQTVDYWCGIGREFGFCLLTSLIFIFVLLWILSPSVKISPFIYKETINNVDRYVFKVINKSFFSCYNVKFDLSRRTPYMIDANKVNHKLATIQLIKPEIFSIPSYKFGKGFGDFAVLVATNIDISQDMGNTDHHEYELSVSVSHGLSNITKVFKKRFKNTSVIKPRPFVFGNNLDIQP